MGWLRFKLSLAMVALPLALVVGCSCGSNGTPAGDARTDGTGKTDGLRADQGPPLLKIVDTCAVPGSPAAGSINTKADVVYGADGQTLDLAWPKGAGPYPLVVLIHGGGWFLGDKSEFEADAERLAGIGYVVANLNYRLAKNPDNLFPTCVEDVRCAVRWLRSQASTYAINTERIVAIGPSAGGQLASMLALAETAAGLDGEDCPAASQPVGISGAIIYYAVSDLRSSSLLGPGEAGTLPNLFGKEPEEVPELAALASPITHVHAGGPPMLLLHGTADTTVPISHSRNLKAALDQAGVPSLLVEVTDADHDFPLFGNTPELLRSSCTALAFLETILR